MLQNLLEMRGHQVAVADNAREAVERLRGDHVEIVLCDIGLPDMTGYDLARAVRGDESLRHLVLIALTGYGQPGDRRRTAEAGFDEHLTKPVDLAAIDEAFGRLAGASRTRRSTT